jgi:tetratricopeptide (TPR) repeat protein
LKFDVVWMQYALTFFLSKLILQARETNMSVSDDICINLAHVHYAQGRFIDAEHQYQATLKAMHSDKNVRTDKLASLCEYSGMAQFSNKRHEESIRSLLRAVHYSPLNLRLWFNVAMVRSEISSVSMQKPRRTVADIEVASEQLNLGQKLFLFLGSNSIAVNKDSFYDRESAQRHARLCEVPETTSLAGFREIICSLLQANKSVFLQQLHATLEEESQRHEERRRQDEEHQQWRRAKDEEKRRQAQVVEDDRVGKQQIAQMKAKKLDELKEKWVAVPSNEVVGKKGGAKGKGKGKVSANGAADSDSDSDLDPLFGSGASASGGALSAVQSTADVGMFGSDDEDEDRLVLKADVHSPSTSSAHDSSPVTKRIQSRDDESHDDFASAKKRIRRENDGEGEASDNDDLFGDGDDGKNETTTTNFGSVLMDEDDI